MAPSLDLFNSTRRTDSAWYGPRASSPAAIPAPSPIKPLVRKWSLAPWKETSFLDVALSDGEDDTSGLDVLNNLITQGGNYLTSRNNPFGTYIPRPGVGQAVPIGSTSLGLGFTPTQLLLIGAAVLGVVLIAKKK